MKEDKKRVVEFMKKNEKLKKIEFIINISFLISVSLSLINGYGIIALALTIILGLLTVWTKKRFPNSSLEFPGFNISATTSIIILIFFVTYIRAIAIEHMNTHIKYILFISVLIIYVSTYIMSNKK